jgi:hypothetical protein
MGYLLPRRHQALSRSDRLGGLALLVLAVLFAGLPAPARATAQIEPFAASLDPGTTSWLAHAAKKNGSPTYINTGGVKHTMSGVGAQKPALIYFGYNGSSIIVSGDIGSLRWSSWGHATAEATGQLFTQWSKSRGPSRHGQEESGKATVTLSGRTNCAGQWLYTKYKLTLGPGTKRPRYFRRVEDGGAPCYISVRDSGNLGGFTPYLHGYLRYPNGRNMWCGVLMTPRSMRSKPIGGCFRVRHWNSRRATALGFIRLGVAPGTSKSIAPRDYAVRVTFTRAKWCHGSRKTGSMLYTRQRLVVYGDGVPNTSKGHLLRSKWLTLRRMIDKRGVKRRVLGARSERSWRCDT